MTLTFVGHGYVGLVTACVFADFGNKVYVLGRTEEKLERLKKGDPIIYEPGLKELLEKNIGEGRIVFTKDYKECIPKSDIVFIAVGTPMGKNKEADLTSVFDASEKIAKNLKNGYTVVCCKSTVPMGTNAQIKQIISQNKDKSGDISFDIASCPEFLREGTAVSDTFNPDRVVIGTDSKKAESVLVELHKPVGGKLILTDIASAEIIKYASNAMLATKISFANLFAEFAEKTDADVEAILEAVGMDKRIGRSFLYPGVGFGGSCLPKDVNALIHISETHKVDPSFFKSVTKINETAKQRFIDKVKSNLQPNAKICIWGLGFKPNTDDIREAPSVYIIKELLENGFSIKVFDPEAQENIKRQFGNKISYGKDQYDALEGCDALCILTEWNQFKEADFDKIKKLIKKNLIFDGRNIYDPKKMRDLGFKYFSVGRKTL